jgi:hypothetical protein
MFVDDEDDFEVRDCDASNEGGRPHAGAAARTLAPRIQEALELFRRVATQEMVNHEFLDHSYRRQRTTFSDGTTVEVDFDGGTYEIKYPPSDAKGRAAAR